MADNVETRGYLFDLDGTVYLGDRPIEGASRVITALRAQGYRVGFLTNNSNMMRETHAARLSRMGIPCEPEDVITAAYVTVLWLLENAPGAKLWVVGEPPFVAKLTAAGFEAVSDPKTAEFVITSFDKTFDYPKLHGALTAINAGARFVVANPDKTCPVDDDLLPDCGSISASVIEASGRLPDVVVGKPSPIMGKAALRIMGLEAASCTMVGDSLATDIAGAVAVGMPTVLVLTGISTTSDIDGSGVRPDRVIDGIWDLV